MDNNVDIEEDSSSMRDNYSSTVIENQNDAAGESDSPETQVASLSPRIMAVLIDMTILGFLSLGCFGVLILSMVAVIPHIKTLTQIAGVSFLIVFFLVSWPPLGAGVYFTLMHWLSGQTIGKWVMGLRVVTIPEGDVTPGRSFLRCAATILSLLPLGAGFLWAAVDSDHMTWHDKIAATLVVYEE